jgi:hypothetical protein
LLVLLATAPLTYSYLASMLNVKLGRTPTAVDFTSASENAPSPEIFFAYAAMASQLAAESNYTEAERLLGLVSKLPSNADQNLITYITLMHELDQILDSLKPRLDQLQDLIAAGAVTQARGNSTEIEALIGEASRRLDLLFSSLDRIGTIYPIDTGNQRRNLETLSNTLRSFEQRLTNLSDQLDALDQRAATQVDLRVYPNPVQAEGTLGIWGQLESGGLGLGGRVVELWINGIQIANLTLDQLGTFAWQYVVSNASRGDKLEVYARYSPTGEDLPRFRPAKSATATVPVSYRPATLTIFASSKRVLVLENFSVQGQLADLFGNPLAGKTVDLLADGEPLNSSVTDSAGKYSINTALPAGTPEGEHQLRTQFEPKQGIYAAANSENTTIQLYYLKPTLTQLGLSGFPTVGGGFIIMLSGQTAQIEGRLGIDSKPFAQGLVIAFLGDHELGRTLSDTNGTFRMPITVPLDLSDVNTILVDFVPANPWIASITVPIVVRVLNSVVVGLAIGATVFAVLVFSGTAMDARSVLRRRVVVRRRPETGTIAFERPEVKEEAVSAAETLSLRDFKLELQLGLKVEEPHVFVKAVYWEIRRMLAEVLGATGERSETPREFSSRVMDKLGAAASSLSALTRLFEIAEYSQHAISRLEAQEGSKHALRIAEEMDARMKP